MLARLSGSTAEFLSIWNIMMTGHSPFQLASKYNHLQLSDTNSKTNNNNNITLESNQQHQGEGECSILTLNPILPAWLFNQQTKLLSFIFLGTIEVKYYNPLLINTWEAKEILGIARDKTDTIYHTTFLITSPLSSTSTSSPSSDEFISYFSCEVSNLARRGELKTIEITII